MPAESSHYRTVWYLNYLEPAYKGTVILFEVLLHQPRARRKDVRAIPKSCQRCYAHAEYL